MIRALVLGIAALAAVGCGSSRGPYNANASDHRDIRRAEETFQKAIVVLDSNPAKAEQLLRETLGYDLYHGGAHNDLGVLLLKEDQLYDAAEEFEWARKLLPGHPEPRVNLALVLDRGGKHQEAVDAAKSALEAAPGNLAAIETIALIEVREGLVDPQTTGYLDTIIQRGDSHWRDWAEEHRLKFRAER